MLEFSSMVLPAPSPHDLVSSVKNPKLKKTAKLMDHQLVAVTDTKASIINTRVSIDSHLTAKE